MVSKQDVEKIKSEMDQLQEVINSTAQQQAQKSKELLSTVLSCEEILNQASWRLQDQFTLCSSTTDHSILSDYLQSDYHCAFENEIVSLVFSDGDIYLHFKDRNSLTQLIETYHINLETHHLLQRAKMLEKTIQTNQKELDVLNEKIKEIQHLNEVSADYTSPLE